MLLMIALASIPLGVCNLLLANILIGMEKVRSYNISELLSRGAVLLLILPLFLREESGPALVFFLTFIAGLISFFYIFRVIKKHLSGHIAVSWLHLKQHMGFGFKAYVAAFFAFLVLKADILMVQYFLGSTQSGLYSITAAMAELMYLLPGSIGLLLFSRLSGMEDEKRMKPFGSVWWFLRRPCFFV
jgi:O-antigen/teichoic acid export membrane protein